MLATWSQRMLNNSHYQDCSKKQGNPNFPEIKTAPLISLGVLCDYVCTTTPDKQTITVHKMDNNS